MKKTEFSSTAMAVIVAFSTLQAASQSSSPAPAASAPRADTSQERWEHYMRDSVDQTYTLHYAWRTEIQNEILTAVRNMVDPQTKIFLVPNSDLIAVHAPEDTQTQIGKLIAALDKPHGRYRLTYTVTEMDGKKKIGVQHFAMVALAGQRTQMKQGSRIPILTGNITVDSHASNQYTYVDVGMNFDATLDEVQGGGMLRTKVEQSSIAPDPNSASNANPIIRQTTLEGTSSLITAQPLLLGSLDVPSSTRHFDIEVVMEPVN